MPLESLLELVETLQSRIDEHGAALRQNEMRTRYALIDPLLQELSWDTSNPSEVMIEDGSGDGRADYLLLDSNQPVMIIEAKRLGLGVSDGRQQAANYAMDPGRKARYFAATDGNQWEIYDTHQPAISMLVISFALREDAPAEVCLKALALWHPSVEHGSVAAAAAPLVEIETTAQGAAQPISATSQRLQLQGENDVPESVRKSLYQTPIPSIASKGIEQGWIPLSEFTARKHTSPPIEIQFPDYSNALIKRWNAITIEIVRWLFTHEFLNQSNWNIRRNVRYFVSDSKIHSSGKEFKNPHDVGPLWVEGDFTGVDHVKNTCFIIRKVGQDPSQFKVRQP